MVRSSSLYLHYFHFSWVRLRANMVVWALPGVLPWVPGHEIIYWPILWYGGIRVRLPGAKNEGVLECGGGMEMFSKRFEMWRGK